MFNTVKPSIKPIKCHIEQYEMVMAGKFKIKQMKEAFKYSVKKNDKLTTKHNHVK